MSYDPYGLNQQPGYGQPAYGPGYEEQLFCPKSDCRRHNVPMQKINDRGVTVDFCPNCRSKFFDDGEVEQLINYAIRQGGGRPVRQPQRHHAAPAYGHGGHGGHGGYRHSSVSFSDVFGFSFGGSS